jgi:virulence-associated protein VagC
MVASRPSKGSDLIVEPLTASWCKVTLAKARKKDFMLASWDETR